MFHIQHNYFVFLVLSAFTLMCSVTLGNESSCNEAICGSIVSKCMLTDSCRCEDKNNVTCSKNCFYCLDFLYHECCSCVEMCPKQNVSDFTFSSTSHVEELSEPSPELFTVLTEEPDRLLRWTSYTYPVHVSFTSATGASQTIEFIQGNRVTTKTDNSEDNLHVNCTVAYMAQCMSWNKCKASCLSMGAASYRWFHDGCCECVGPNCVNYGINNSRCLQCPYREGEQPTSLSLDTSETEMTTSVAETDFLRDRTSKRPR